MKHKSFKSASIILISLLLVLGGLAITQAANAQDNVTALTGWVSGTVNAKVSGSNRLMTVMVMGEGNTSFTAATGVTYGGQTMTKQGEKIFHTGGNRTYASIFTLNEAGVAAASTDLINVTWIAPPSVGYDVCSVLLANVDQTTPISAIADSAKVDSIIVTKPLAAGSGDMVLMCGATSNNKTQRFNNGFIKMFESADSRTWGDGVYGYKLGSGTTEIPSFTQNDNNRIVLCAMVVKKAVPDSVTALTGWVSGTMNAKVSGSNRLLVVMLGSEYNGADMTSSVTYGGQAMTRQAESQEGAGTGYRTYASIYTLNEAGVSAATSDAIDVTWNVTFTNPPAVHSVLLGNVDQTTPVSAVADSNVTTSTTISTKPLAAGIGDMVIMCGATAANNKDTLNNGFTKMFESNQQFGDGVGGYKMGSGASETPSYTQSGSGRMTLAAIVVKKAGSVKLYSLTTSAVNGSVTINPPGSSHPAGTVVTLTANPNSGFEFQKWSGDLSGSTNPATITMDSDKSIAALFVPSNTAVENDMALLPRFTELMQNYPNPFNPETTIPYELAESSHVRVVIFNLFGQQVATLVDKLQSAGHYTVNWNSKDDAGQKVASGVYIYRLETDASVQMKKFILLQ